LHFLFALIGGIFLGPNRQVIREETGMDSWLDVLEDVVYIDGEERR